VRPPGPGHTGVHPRDSGGVGAPLPRAPWGGGRPRSWPLSTEKRGREQTVRASALMGGAGLRYGCLQEAQLGDAIALHEPVDLTIFRSKTDTTLTGL
jgi:hypothetical protein